MSVGSLQFSFEIFWSAEPVLNMRRRILQFSFEIFVEPEVRVVRDRVLKTLQFSFEILRCNIVINDTMCITFNSLLRSSPRNRSQVEWR